MGTVQIVDYLNQVDTETKERVALGVPYGVYYTTRSTLSSYADVRLISNEGSVLSINRVVLAACSQFFRKLFFNVYDDGSHLDSDLIISTEVKRLF